ncbi:AI-2E family transporter [uncultured Amnibacterium sp.]|uniref:AI-2E family transporter n=1 Tax=uncultured Amnibacterium sp. TaxID=1631851 RepID=UPI0035CA290C
MPRRTEDTGTETDDVVSRAVPVSLKIAGAWSWRVIGVLVLIAVVLFLIVQLHIVVIPVAVAVLLSALLTPVKRRLLKWGWPRWLAVVVTFVGLLVIIAGLVTLVVLTLRAGLPGFETQVGKSYDTFLAFLRTGPLGFSEADLMNLIASATKAVQSNSGSVVSGAVAGASTIGDLAVGLLLTLFTTLFFVLDGAGIWRWCVRLAPRRARAAVDGAGRAVWLSVGEYARVQIIVALIDAIGIGIVAAVLQLPFVFAIAVVVFLGAFIPIIGAVTTGSLAVIVALIYPGLFPDNTVLQAVIMLAGLIAVNQLESHILQPLLMGTAVRLHPIAVVVSVALGSLLGGIAGAVFAVPFAAALNSAVKFLAGGSWKGQPPPPTDDVPHADQDRPSRRRDRRPRPQDVKTVA